MSAKSWIIIAALAALAFAIPEGWASVMTGSCKPVCRTSVNREFVQGSMGEHAILRRNDASQRLRGGEVAENRGAGNSIPPLRLTGTLSGDWDRVEGFVTFPRTYEEDDIGRLELLLRGFSTVPGAATGVYVVPAFAGLGSPWWDPYARGTIVGITRGTGRAEITRAVVESMAFQTRDVIDAMTAASGTEILELRVDGGASVMDILCQFQADQLGVTVLRPSDQETTALGAAFLAGLAEGVWPDLDAVGAQWSLEAEFPPEADRQVADALHTQWLRAVDRSRDWIRH